MDDSAIQLFFLQLCSKTISVGLFSLVPFQLLLKCWVPHLSLVLPLNLLPFFSFLYSSYSLFLELFLYTSSSLTFLFTSSSFPFSFQHHSQFLLLLLFQVLLQLEEPQAEELIFDALSQGLLSEGDGHRGWSAVTSAFALIKLAFEE